MSNGLHNKMLMVLNSGPSIDLSGFVDAEPTLSHIRTDAYQLYSHSNNKFDKDEIFFESDQFLLLLRGVVVNKNQFKGTRVEEDWSEIFLHHFNLDAEKFVNKLRGSFFIVIYDKRGGMWYFFVDQVCSKHLYYSCTNGIILVSSSFDLLVNAQKHLGFEVSPEISSMYSLISYGFMLEDHTLCSSIRKIRPGCFLCVNNGRLEVKKQTYHRFKGNECQEEKGLDVYVDELDDLFRQAVERQFQKDIEYGYHHLVNLSGGLDSRMTSWVAHCMGYRNQLNITFSQSGAMDESIAEAIACELNHRWLYKTLDDAHFMLDYNRIIRISGGSACFAGLACGLSLLELMNLDGFGLDHTGQLGDVILGTYSSGKKHRNWLKGDGALSKKLLGRLDDFEFEETYDNEEIFKLYNRCFNGVNTGLLGIQEFTETMSPFYDVDFFEYMLSVPVQYRYKHNIYRKWILTKYPGAARHPWERTGCKIKSRNWIKYRGTYYPLKAFITKVVKTIRLKVAGRHSSHDMNPFDYWLNHHSYLMANYQDFFNSSIDKVADFQLRSDLIGLFEKGGAMDKAHVITALSANNKYFA